LTILNPLAALVDGRRTTWIDEAFTEYGRGKFRGAYDLLMLTLNDTLFEHKAEGHSLFIKLSGLARKGLLDAQVVDLARSLPFLDKHDRGITDIDLSYMSEHDLYEFITFLEAYFRSLKKNSMSAA